MLKNALLVILVWFFLVPISLATNSFNIQPLLSNLPSGAIVSFVLLDPSNNRTLSDYQGKFLLKPASLQKITTAVAALLQLGADFRYQTSIGTTKPLHKGSVTGDLWIRFSGDPTFTSEDLGQLIKIAKKQGLKRIKGDIVLYDGVFLGYSWGQGWSWDTRSVCYAAPISSIMLNANCLYAQLSPSKVNHYASFKAFNKKRSQGVSLISEVVTRKHIQSSDWSCPLEVDKKDNNVYKLRGCLSSKSSPRGLALSIMDPNAYAIAQVRSLLKFYDIPFTGKIRVSSSLTTSKYQLAEHKSQPLLKLVHTMLKHSDNQLAGSLVKTVGAHYYNSRGSFLNGTHAVKALIKSASGVDLHNTVATDGSGLSRDNLVSAKKLVALLSWVKKDFKYRTLFYQSLPIAGQDGTLKYHFGRSGKSLRGKVVAKTGTLNGVRNLAGFIQTRSGKKLVFALLISGYHPSGASGKQSVKAFQSQVLEKVRASY